MKKIFIFLFAISIVNCISFRSGEYIGTPSSDFSLAKKQSIKIDFSYDYLVDGTKEPTPNQIIVNTWIGFGEETLKEIPNVSVTKEDSLADFIFEVKVQEKSDTLSTQILPIISGLTLMVLPFYASAENHMETTVKNKKGQILGKVVKQEEFSILGQLFLILAMPFTSFIENANEQKKDMFKATYKEIQDLKILTATPKK